MKKLLIAMLSVISITTFAQSPDFPDQNIELLEGKELLLKPLDESSQKYGYKEFYSDEAAKKIYKKGSLFSKYSALAGKTFKVVSYKPEYSDYIIKLSNPDTGIIYYKYNPTRSYDFPFKVIGGLTFPENFFCKYIISDRKFDYDKEEHYYLTHSPCTEDICLYEKEKNYWLHVLITAPSDKRETGLKGVKFILENGKEVSFPNVDVSVTASLSKYDYSAEIRGLKPEELQLLAESPIVKKIVGTKEKEVENGRVIMEYIKCMTKK